MLIPLRDRAAISAASRSRAWGPMVIHILGELVEVHGCEADLAIDGEQRAMLTVRPVPGEQGGAIIDADAPGLESWLHGVHAWLRAERCERVRERTYERELGDLAGAVEDYLDGILTQGDLLHAVGRARQAMGEHVVLGRVGGGS